MSKESEDDQAKAQEQLSQYLKNVVRQYARATNQASSEDDDTGNMMPAATLPNTNNTEEDKKDLVEGTRKPPAKAKTAKKSPAKTGKKAPPKTAGRKRAASTESYGDGSTDDDQEDESREGETKQQRRRRMNRISAKKKRAKKMIEMEYLGEEQQRLNEENTNLKNDNEHLKERIAMVRSYLPQGSGSGSGSGSATRESSTSRSSVAAVSNNSSDTASGPADIEVSAVARARNPQESTNRPGPAMAVAPVSSSSSYQMGSDSLTPTFMQQDVVSHQNPSALLGSLRDPSPPNRTRRVDISHLNNSAHQNVTGSSSPLQGGQNLGLYGQTQDSPTSGAGQQPQSHTMQRQLDLVRQLQGQLTAGQGQGQGGYDSQLQGSDTLSALRDMLGISQQQQQQQQSESQQPPLNSTIQNFLQQGLGGLHSPQLGSQQDRRGSNVQHQGSPGSNPGQGYQSQLQQQLIEQLMNVQQQPHSQQQPQQPDLQELLAQQVSLARQQQTHQQLQQLLPGLNLPQLLLNNREGGSQGQQQHQQQQFNYHDNSTQIGNAQNNQSQLSALQQLLLNAQRQNQPGNNLSR